MLNTKFFCQLIGCLCGVQKLHTLVIGGSDQPLWLNVDADNADAQFPFLQNQIGLDHAGECGTRKIVVARHKGKIGQPDYLLKYLHPVVKLVIAQRGCVVPHQVHRFHFYLSLEKVEVGCSLKKISRIKEKDLLVGLPYLINVGCPAYYSSQAGSAPVGRRQWLNTAVGIVGVQDYKSLPGKERGGKR